MSHVASNSRQPWPVARYRLLQKSYIARTPDGEHELIDPEAPGVDPHVIWSGKPGPHMEATCELGQAAKARAGMQTLNPASQLSLVMGEDANLDNQIREMQARLTEMLMQRHHMATAPMPEPGAPMLQEPPPNAPEVIAAAPVAPPPVYKIPKPPR